MAETLRTLVDLSSHVAGPAEGPKARLSTMAQGLQGSEILKIAAEIRALVARGQKVCDLTVGDFAPRYFPIPSRLRDLIREALDRGETNYPPSNGLPALREAVRRLFARELGLEYPLESVLVAGGSRPLIYGLFRTVLDPGDRVVYPVPSWNNNHYAHMVGAVSVPLLSRAEDRFMPTRGAIQEALPGARLFCLNSPLNPSGTVIAPASLLGISEAILEENRTRAQRGEKPLFLMYDQVYWMLCFGGASHVTPPELVPEMARYTILVDGISKGFAATGLRVGWAVGPTDLIARMSSILGHVGAWAPRAEQAATAIFLDEPGEIRAFRETFSHQVKLRLDRLHSGLQELKSRGLPVESIPPEAAIYLTARIHPFGRRTPSGEMLTSNEAVRRFLLESAGIGVIPFEAFGAPADDGWFRLSVGAVDQPEIDSALGRLQNALSSLQGERAPASRP
jgi:aspartate aminotransferase